MDASTETKYTPRVLSALQDFWHAVGHKKTYLIPLVIISALSYTYSVVNETLSIDDLRRDFYLGSKAAKLAGRWGMILWTRLLGSYYYAPFIDRFFSAVFMVCAAICLAALLYRIGKSKTWAYTVFSCAFVSYPLINEIWEYTVTDFMIFGNLFLASLILLHLHEHDPATLLSVLKNKDAGASLKLRHICAVYLMPVFLMSVIASSYESGVTFYVSATMVMLFYRYCVVQTTRPAEQSAWEWVFRGIHFAVPVVAGVVLSSLIGFFIRTLLHLSAFETGDNTIRWGETTAWGLFKLVVTNYAAKGLLYYPVTLFVILTAIFTLYCLIRSVRTRRVLPLLLGALLFLSLFLLTVIQGSIQPYRASQCFSVYVAFVLFLVAHTVLTRETGSVRAFYAAVLGVGICMVLCLHMAAFMNWILAMNHRRSENESALAWMIGYRAMTEYQGKRICFVGWGSSGDYLERLLRTDPQTKRGNYYIRIYRRLWHEDPANLRSAETNVNSVITWSKGTHDDMMYQYFNYHGFSLNIVPWTEQDVHMEAVQTAKELGLRPYEVSEQENYVIVCLPWLDF